MDCIIDGAGDWNEYSKKDISLIFFKNSYQIARNALYCFEQIALSKTEPPWECIK